jgi:2'-5' RNA ligase
MKNTNAPCMYFVAIVCPEELNKKIVLFKLWMQEKFGCRVALKSPAHITLIPPFWFDESGENILLGIISSFHSKIEELVIQLEGFSHFSKSVLFINIKPNQNLYNIGREIESHFKQRLGAIIKEETRPFTPHITIATRDLKPGDFIKAWEHFSNKFFEDNFQTNQIFLLKLSPEKWNVIAEKNWKS